MTTYQIQVLNQSGFAKSYVFFLEPPDVDGMGSAPTVQANAWVTFNSVTTGGFDSATFDDSVYAYWGTTPDALGPGTVLASGGTALVDLDAQDQVSFTASPTGFGPASPGMAATGAYAIAATNDFTAADGFAFGMAKGAGTPIPAPTATFLAEPGDTFNITPQMIFYVSDGAYTSGQVLDYSALVVTAATVDFSDRSQTTATVTQDAQGAFTVAYS
ncbi:hypothetical protein [Caulobacter soli]|uniref:hypothetical protein n=1 Tax=Caulobacter soli TaxID=2708539 RepID=UPI0013EC6654|nr:hypothetical protein [Caulobacter soli]